jgi:hypothetical protein
MHESDAGLPRTPQSGKGQVISYALRAEGFVAAARNGTQGHNQNNRRKCRGIQSAPSLCSPRERLGEKDRRGGSLLCCARRHRKRSFFGSLCNVDGIKCTSSRATLKSEYPAPSSVDSAAPGNTCILAPHWRAAFGTLTRAFDFPAIVERAMPVA